MRYQFTLEQRDLLITLITWFWASFNKAGYLNFGVTLEDYEFMYSLWKNGVGTYDDKMQDRLNSIRDVYLDNQT